MAIAEGIEQDRWTRVKGRLRSTVGEDVYSSWFARMDLERVGGESVHLSVPTRFLKSWIQTHYADRVLSCWQAELPDVHRIDLTVRTPVRAPAVVKDARTSVEERLSEHEHRPSELRAVATVPVSASHEALGGSPLDPRLTFATFVGGRSNTLALAAARQVAEGRRGDNVMFNPLYIHAGVGLGKTHLLQAVTWAGNSADRKVLYLTAEKFMYGFVAALKTQTALAFKEALRGIDVLVIDDLQFLQGKSTQAEFCHTLNALIDAGRQVVIAADRPPSDLESLDDRVRSRLAGGLVVEMGALGEELRLEILKSRVSAARTHHASFDVPLPVLDYLAKAITHNGRDLEGAINRLLAHSKLNSTSVTLEMAEREVRDLIRPQEPRRVKIEDIQRVVARQYNVSRSDLLSSRRTANVVRPRQVAMYLAKTLTLRSLPEIGRRFGGRDHTTVLHAVRKIEALVSKDIALSDEVELLKRQLQE
ncbi:chromosomal replication initiator protein DnaA [[Pseudomonas] carboxydohydrogena]|uniref:Chromosomal replication initiator protein DnaA n=1 Tax=Afipia carboxydohydrogena TaxID=290 RepID=A0ABY8BPW0_AFICR|nr:chromosomal replication initiator protein DnaA [[Pseudomonas] carboxydohydrogena]WEF51566.1 chromosomal replication initiator protein DnaA [[Pseudomonas] carboxydohydrogena]